MIRTISFYLWNLYTSLQSTNSLPASPYSLYKQMESLVTLHLREEVPTLPLCKGELEGVGRKSLR